MKYKINLFPPREQNLVDRTAYFSFHYLRYILVITQIVVIGVFFYRFKIDQEIVDLKDSLNQKQEIVAVSAPLIDQMKQLDKKTASIQTILTNQQKFQDIFNYILSIFPEKLTLNQMVIDDKGAVQLSGVTVDPGVVKLFYDRLKKDNKFAVVNLKSLKKDLYGFTFNLELLSSAVKKK